MTTYAELCKGFVSPPRAYGLLPLWDLNNDLKTEDLHWGLDEQARQGISGVFLHPRSGMEVEYLSADYWRAIGESIALSKTLGLETWLYDEYNWPSGVAGGELLRTHPEFRQTYLDYRRVHCLDGESCELNAPPNASVLSARAWREGSEAALDLTGEVQANALRWTSPQRPAEADDSREAAQAIPTAIAKGEVQDSGQSQATEPSGPWHVVILFSDLYPGRLWAAGGAPWTRNEAGALDYLNPDAVREFMRLTHEAYRERFGTEFGKQIPGIFTDEPGTYYGWQWTPRFLERFREAMGYDLAPHLHELVLPVGNYVKTRCDYHRAALDMYASAFFQQIAEWSERNGLISTGHLLYEDKLDYLPSGQGGFFSTLRHLHMPGIDYLGDRTGYEPSDIFVAPNVGPKSLSSLAHATGKHRSLVELYGGNGWATTLARYKNVLNWVEACGVNCIDPHAAYLSLKGHRKRDFPASHFVQNPWWRYYHHFAAYVTRLSYLNAQGRHMADIALLYPQSTFWTEHVIGEKSAAWNNAADSFTAISTALLRLQRDYDYLFEETLLDGAATAADGKLHVGGESFSIVVLPPLTTIPFAALQCLRDFAEGGGKLVALGQLPVHSSEQRDDPRMAAVLAELRKQGRLTFAETPASMSETEWLNLLRPLLDELQPADVAIDAPFAHDVMVQHRLIDDAHFYLIANLSGQEGTANIALRPEDGSSGPSRHVEVWDVERGERATVAAATSADGRTVVSYHLLPCELMILVAGTGDDPAAPAASNAARLARAPAVAESELVFADWRIEPESVNCLMLEPWQVRHGDEVRAMPNSRYDSLEAMSRVGRQQAAAQGLDPSEWTFFMRVARDPNMQARSSLWPPEGAEYERTTTFRAEYIPNDLMLVFEDLGDPVAIDINGERHHGAPEPCFVWDRANRQVALRGLVRLGENTVILRTRMPGYRSLPPGSHGMEPVALRGSFAVRAGALAAPEPEMDPRATTARADEAPAAAEPTRWRSWEEFGWPSYSGAMTYHARFHLPVELAGRNLLLECADVRETMEVSVNGRPVGLRLWPPYRLDISAAAQAGDNTLAITVTNTLSNLFTRPLSSGLLAPVRIAVMPDDVPAGVPLVSV